MIRSSPKMLPSPSLYLDDGLRLCGVHVPAASVRSLHE